MRVFSGQILVGLVAGALVAHVEPAGAQTCNNTSDQFDGSASPRRFKLNTNNQSSLQGVSAADLEIAVQMAAATWNEHGTSGTFRYAGTVYDSDGDLPSTNCQSIDYSLVSVITTNQDNPKARVASRCDDDQFAMKIYVYDNTNLKHDWQVFGNTIAAGNVDLVAVLTHEFGHTFNMGHPNDSGGSGDYAVMWGSDVGEDSNRQRELYSSDIHCARDRGGFRLSAAQMRQHQGTWGSEVAPFGTWQVAHVSVGRTWHSPANWSAVGNGAGNAFWAKGLNTSNVHYVDAEPGYNHNLARYTAAVFREDTSNDRMLYSTFSEFPTAGDEDAVHRVMYVRSTDAFVTGSRGTLKECTSMTGFLSCSNSVEIQSGKEVAVGWNDGIDRSVIAWVHQNRTNDTQTSQVRVAVGYVPEDRLPVASTPFGASTVAPGVACKNNKVKDENGTTFDCMIAVVSPTETEANIDVYRFNAVEGTNQYSLEVSPYVWQFAIAPTVTRIAAWYSAADDKFWIAYRTANSSNQIHVRSSADTTSWSSASIPGNSATSDIGPSAVGYFQGSTNYLMYMR